MQLDDLLLDDHVRETCDELILEQRKADVLAEAGLAPRNRVCSRDRLENGKTSLAEGIATALRRPFYSVSYDTLIGSHLGETAGRLQQVADYISSYECVALLDEFETISKERDDDDEVGEMKRIVASLLVHLEHLPPSTVIVAATNHPAMLDRATWRRFQITLELGTPGRKELTDYFESRRRKAPRLLLDASAAAETLEGASYAEAAEFCDDVERQQVLRPKQGPEELFRQRLARWAASRAIHPQRPGTTPMNKQPINAAELVLKGHTGLSRYKTIPVALTKLSGWLEDVETTGENDAWIVVRPVDGLPGHNMATATIRNPAPEVDQLLERIGRNGQITLIGIASTKTDGIALLRMSEIHSINGTPVAATRR